MGNKHEQYGKKGRKPRIPYEVKKFNMDEVVTNDIRYWNKTSGFDNVTTFLWDLIIGTPRDVEDALVVPTTSHFDMQAEPKLNPAQIMAIDIVTGPGYAATVKDGVNRSLAMIMAKIRATLSTANIGFETADLGIFLTSTASITNAIAYAKKVLECYTMWKDRNIAWPMALIKSMGFEYSDIRDNINTYMPKLNAAIDMYNNIQLPDFSDVYDRQYTLFHNVYADEDSQFGQLYHFRPRNFYSYVDDPSETGTTYAYSEEIIWDGADGEVTFTNFGDYIDKIEQMINAWYGSSDLYQINGVLKRAFKDVPRQNVPYFEKDTVVEAHVDREHLMQIMNCTICPIDFKSLDLTQDGLTQNYVKWQPTAPASTMDSMKRPPQSHVLRLFENDISKDDNMELTRLLNFCSDSTTGYMYMNCGSEIVTRIYMYTWNVEDESLRGVHLDSNTLTLTDGAGSLYVSKLATISPFRYIPCVYLASINSIDNHMEFLGILGDMYNWMIYTKKDWDMLQFVAYQSLWTPKNI